MAGQFKKPPILEFPGRGRAVIEADRLFANKPRIPGRVVLCFFLEILRAQRRKGRLSPLLKLRGEGEPIQVFRLGTGRDALTVCFPGVGAPLAAAVLEELIGLGGRRFVVCGGAGVLDGGIPAGTTVVPVAAVRDEGTSYHYQPPGRLSRPHRAAVAAIEAACRSCGLDPLKGLTWTTDAVYRETISAVRRRRAEGCLTVEMEAAALFAVARFRKVVLGQVLYAGDDVSGADWDGRDWDRLARTRKRLFELAVDACRRIPKGAAR